MPPPGARPPSAGGPTVDRPLEVCHLLEVSLLLPEVPQVVRLLEVSHHLPSHLAVNG
jgi:hypothetical protein